MSIQREIKQTRPFGSKGEEAAVALMRTADLLRRAIGNVVDRYGITLQQYNVLRILRGAGRQGLPTLEIADRMIEQTPGITRLIDRLEGKHLVVRSRSTNDRRCVYCRITSAGLALLATAEHPMRTAAESGFKHVKRRRLAGLGGLRDRNREG